MYRYCVDEVVTYNSEDIVLFRESPFACWMERLTLENPGHGIPADVGSTVPPDLIQRQDDVADTLRAEGRDVTLIDWELPEPDRREASLAAMRSGADFIVNAQLASGPLSGPVNLLMRTSGYSDLGDFLYIPCHTQVITTADSAFRLCFLADLLHSLQGQLPPQLLILRGGGDLLQLQTEDHIYYYHAVMLRFMTAMLSFRKHKMPDPAESSQLGRWSACANEVLKQRAVREPSPPREAVAPAEVQVPAPQSCDLGGPSPYDLENIRETRSERPPEPVEALNAAAAAEVRPVITGTVGAMRASGGRNGANRKQTVAAQAPMLPPEASTVESDSVPPGPAPGLASVVEIGGAEEPSGGAPGRTITGQNKPRPLDSGESGTGVQSVVDLDIENDGPVPLRGFSDSLNTNDNCQD